MASGSVRLLNELLNLHAELLGFLRKKGGVHRDARRFHPCQNADKRPLDVFVDPQKLFVGQESRLENGSGCAQRSCGFRQEARRVFGRRLTPPDALGTFAGHLVAGGNAPAQFTSGDAHQVMRQMGLEHVIHQHRVIDLTIHRDVLSSKHMDSSLRIMEKLRCIAFKPRLHGFEDLG